MSKAELLSGKPYQLFFQALANPTRMKIVSHLRHQKSGRSVSEICAETGVEQTQASHALKCLAFCGLVTSVRIRKSIVYSLNEDTLIPLLSIVDKHLERHAQNLYTCDALER